MNQSKSENSGGVLPDAVEDTVKWTVRHARKLVVAVVGTTLLLIGIVMTITPGPAMVLIPLGLAVLAIEFAWARRLLCRVKEQLPEQFRSDRHNSK